MRTRCLIGVLTLLLLFGFSGSVFAAAVTDPADARVAGYDIEEARVEVGKYDGDTTASGDIPEVLRINLTMAEGSSLPGLTYFEFDVDGDLNTGGTGSMCGIFDSCGAPGDKIKVQPGIDIAIMMILRDQGSGAATAWCDNCFGPESQCAKRGVDCSVVPCEQSNCYTAGDDCDPSYTNCYEIGAECNLVGTSDKCEHPGPGGDSCRMLIDDCVATEPCGIGRVVGEWYATAVSGNVGAGEPAYRGRIDMPLPKEGAGDADSDCYVLPWAAIVEGSHAQVSDKWCVLGDNNKQACDDDGDCPGGTCEVNSKKFDIDKAKDPANLGWQISAWLYPGVDPKANGENDFFISDGGICAAVSDVVPDSGLASIVVSNYMPDPVNHDYIHQQRGICTYNSNQDYNVDSFDNSNFNSQFGRILFNNPCGIERCPPEDAAPAP